MNFWVSVEGGFFEGGSRQREESALFDSISPTIPPNGVLRDDNINKNKSIGFMPKKKKAANQEF